jgi:hypothetical protein
MLRTSKIYTDSLTLCVKLVLRKDFYGASAIFEAKPQILRSPRKVLFLNEGAKLFLNQAEGMTNVACIFSTACIT